MKKIVYQKIVVVLLLLLIGKTTWAQWSKVSPAGAVGRFRQSVFVIGDTAYMGNGHTPGYTTTWTGYTQNGNTWVNEPTYPGGGGDQGYFFSINDTGYVGAGANPGWNTDSYSYTPATGWSYKGTPPGGTRIFGVGFSIGHYGYMGTGINSSNAVLSDLWQYDSYTNSWTQKMSLPVPRGGGVAFSANGKGYIGLGYASNTTSNAVLNDMYQYDPGSNSWTTMAPMPPFGEAEPAYFVLCGKLFVVSGLTAHNNTVATNQTWMFDPSNGPTGTWTRLPDFPGTPGYSPQGFAMGDTGFVFGGDSLPVQIALAQMWRYVPFLSLTLANVSDTVVCPGTAVTLNAAGGATYTWSTGTVNGSANDTTSSITVTPTVTTTYYYTATGNACLTTSDSLVVKVNLSRPLTVSPQSPKICNGSGIALNVPVSGTNYNWSPAAGLSATTGATVTANPTATTIYTVTGNDSLGCPAHGTDTVFVGSLQNVSILPDSPAVCNGQSITLKASVSGSPTYNWVGTGGDVSDSLNIHPIKDTTYELIINSGACSLDTIIAVKVNTPAPLYIQPQSPFVCSGLPVTLSVPVSGSNYTWTPATGLNSTTGDSVVIVNPTATATYIVNGLDSLGCAVSDTDIITVIPAPNKPTITVSVTGDTLTSSAGSYNQWNFNGQAINDSTRKILIIKGHARGYYTVTVTNPANGCTTTSDSTTSINQLAMLRDELSIYPNPFSNTIYVRINSSAPNISEWSLQLTDVLGRTLYTNPSLSYSNQINLSNLPSGVYFISIINSTAKAVWPVVKQN